MAKQAQIDAVRPILTEIDHGVTAAEHAIDAVVSGTEKAADILETGLEMAADVVPETVEKSVEVTADVAKRGVHALRNPKVMALIVLLAGAGSGLAVGIMAHKMMRRKLEKEYEERLEMQLEEMRTFYIRRNKEGDFANPVTAAEALKVKEAAEALRKYEGTERRKYEGTEREKPANSPLKVVSDNRQGKNEQTRYDKVVTNEEAKAEIRDHVVKIEVEDTPQQRNVFVDGRPLVDDDWDLAEEETRRNPEHPYVISFEEFNENSFEHEQSSLTYYKGDDVLADEQDRMVYDVEAIVGSDNLVRFGHGSKDPNIVYVRNERTEADYEIALSDGKYAEEVTGFRHSDESPSLRKARWGDDE